MSFRSSMSLAMVLGLFAFGGTVADAQVTFTFSTTASANGSGYVLGNPYAFSFTTGPSYPVQSNLSTSFFSSTNNFWSEASGDDLQLFQTVGGSGLSGTFTRPTASLNDPISFINNGLGGYFRLYAGNNSTYGIGLTNLGGLTGVVSVEAIADNLVFSPATFPQTYVDPTAYFVGFLGSYSVAGTVTLNLNVDSLVTFAVTNVTISSAIPEPSTYAELAGMGILVSSAD